jgi:hypothetical protein
VRKTTLSPPYNPTASKYTDCDIVQDVATVAAMNLRMITNHAAPSKKREKRSRPMEISGKRQEVGEVECLNEINTNGKPITHWC